MERVLSLTDLVIFGTASIVGAGGFNLIGNAVISGGKWWPLPLLGAGAVLLASSRSYEEAYNEFKKNNSESEFIRSIFGDTMSSISTICILMFNIFSIAVTIVLCSQLLLDDFNYIHHISISFIILLAMAAFALQGIQINKEVINFLSILLLGILVIIAITGYYAFIINGYSYTSKDVNMAMSFLFFFYILAGFDAIMKFTDETKEGVYLPSAFYISNVLSILLVLGISLAFLQLPSGSLHLNHTFGAIIESIFGKAVRPFANYAILFYMLLTAFIIFLSNTRYLYDIGGLHTSLSFLKELNGKSVPTNATYLTIAGIFCMILTNAIPLLVAGSDFGIIALLCIMNAAAVTRVWKKGP
jgi:amino acid transporter